MAGEAKQSNMVRKSWFGADLQAAAAAAMAENASLQASNNWYNTLMGAVRQTVVISEILDSRTRNLIAVSCHGRGPFALSTVLAILGVACPVCLHVGAACLHGIRSQSTLRPGLIHAGLSWVQIPRAHGCV